jgi:hypothetical protein
MIMAFLGVRYWGPDHRDVPAYLPDGFRGRLMDFFLQSPLLAGGYVFFISLCVGSFLNVVIYRLPVMMERQWRQEAAELLSEEPVSTFLLLKNSI